MRARRWLAGSAGVPPEPVQQQDVSQNPGRITILAVLAEEQDRNTLKASSQRYGWNAHIADSYLEARQLLTRTQAPIVLCDRDVQDQDWWSMVEGLSSGGNHACIFLVSKVADDYLWNEVVRRGGYDVISKPLREDELERAAKLAWTYWSSTSNRVPAKSAGPSTK